MTRLCAWCRVQLVVTARSDAKFCSQRCRQAAHRFGREAKVRRRAEQPMKFAYADPPYPGLSGYYKDHPDYGGEVDHAALLSHLQGFDGWALSTSARALPQVLALCVAAGLQVRVAAWLRGACTTVSTWPVSSWEPVVYAGGRRLVRPAQTADSLAYVSKPRLTDVNRVIGAKPAAFAYWMFDLLGVLPGDELVDLYPGSGGSVGRGRYIRRVRIPLTCLADPDVTPKRLAGPGAAGIKKAGVTGLCYCGWVESQ